LKFSPLVGLVGHRQVGKTTLGNQITPNYFSMDLRTTLDRVSLDPLGFLESQDRFPTILDECQQAPDLFPALKEYVRRNPQPGRFLLTGSVRFTSRKAIRESLTGRIINLELYPMSVSEIKELENPNSLIRLSHALDWVKKAKPPRFQPGLISEYLERGGLPGIFAIRDSTLRHQKISTQLETILDRDLRLLLDTSLSFSTLRNVLRYLATHQGDALKVTQIARATRVSRPTLQKLLLAFEGLFLIRPMAVEGGTASKIYFLEDQAEASLLIGPRRDPLFDLTRFLYANLRIQICTRPEIQSESFRFETRGGSLVPLAYRIDGKEIGIIPVLEQSPNKSAFASALSFLKKYPHGRIAFIRLRGQNELLAKNMAILSVETIIFGAL